MLSLDERERRAKERYEQKKRRDMGLATRSPSPQPAIAALEAMRAPVEAKGFSPPKPGESLFDNYANLADPILFSTDEEEVEELLKMGVGVGSSWDEERYREAAWDSSPHKNPPAYLKSIKPVTREPWTIDTAVYNAEFNTDFDRPQRYGKNPNPPLSQYREDDPRARPKGAREGWNSQPYHPVPYTLRGLRPAPTSTEPWVEDLRERQGSGFEDTDVIENLTLEDMDNGGASRFKHFKNYKMEMGSIGGKPAPRWDYSQP